MGRQLEHHEGQYHALTFTVDWKRKQLLTREFTSSNAGDTQVEGAQETSPQAAQNKETSTASPFAPESIVHREERTNSLPKSRFQQKKRFRSKTSKADATMGQWLKRLPRIESAAGLPATELQDELPVVHVAAQRQRASTRFKANVNDPPDMRRGCLSLVFAPRIPKSWF